jgi:general secretion pathway protein G
MGPRTGDRNRERKLNMQCRIQTRMDARSADADRRQAREESGFTLLEILIVVTIIGLLMAFVGNRLIGQAEGAKRTLAGAQLRKIEETLELYRLQNGRYPTTEQGLEALVRRPSGEPVPRSYPPGGYMKDDQIRDPWGATFRYEAPGRNNSYAFDLSSLGPDGREGGDGENADIVNWDVAAAR